MPLMKKCCCGRSLRSGCYLSALLSLIWYGPLIHFDIANFLQDKTVMKGLSIAVSLLCLCSACLVVLGLCTMDMDLLLPFIGSVSLSIPVKILDWILGTFPSGVINDSETLFLVLVIFALTVIYIFQIYAVCCVISQYQELRQEARIENTLQQENIEAGRKTLSGTSSNSRKNFDIKNGSPCIESSLKQN